MVFEKEEAYTIPAMERNKRKSETNIDNKVYNDGNKYDPKCYKKEENGNKVNTNDMIVTIAPMEIRAFILEVMY